MKSKLTKANLMNQSSNRTVSVPCHPLHCPKDCAIKFLRFTLLETVQCTALRTMHSAMNSYKFPFPRFTAFSLVMRCPFYLTHSYSLSKFRKRTSLKGFPVVLSVHFGLLGAYGDLQDSSQWHPAIRKGGLRWTQIPGVKIRYYLCSYQTYDLRYISLAVV